MKKILFLILTVFLCAYNPISIEESTTPTQNNNIFLDLKDIDPSKPTVALTFDDGPSKYTSTILDILKNHEVTATFFVLGEKIKEYESTIKKMHVLKNEIGNHSYDHRWGTRITVENFKNQIEKTQDAVYYATGHKPTLYRPAYGSINKKMRNATDLRIVFWTNDSKDWSIKNSNKIADRVLKNVKDGDIILMHDTYERTSEAVKIIVPALLKKGYQLVTVSTLKEIQAFRENT